MTKVGCRFIYLLKHLFMESKITISFDYIQKIPFIKINYVPSEDERDKMIGAFLSSIPGEVSFTKFQYEQYSETGGKIAGVRPITFGNLSEELKTVQTWVDSFKNNSLSKKVLQDVPTTSPFFRELLQKEGIYFEEDDANGVTLVSGKVNLFNLGVEWGKYCAKSDVHIE